MDSSWLGGKEGIRRTGSSDLGDKLKRSGVSNAVYFMDVLILMLFGLHILYTDCKQFNLYSVMGK